MNLDANKLRIELNIGNFADPFYNVERQDRAAMECALASCVLAGEVASDKQGGWELTLKGKQKTADMRLCQQLPQKSLT
jgi:hypothetical protein